mgnify:CR=1 FL=1
MPVITNEFGEKIEEGCVGNLTGEQNEALRKFWQQMFVIFDSKLEVSDDVDRKGGLAAVSKGMEVNKGDPKENKKEESKSPSKVIDDCLNKYGGRYVRQGFFEATKFDFPDMTALRFLRARKFDVQNAIAMCIGAVMFRLDARVEEILFTGELGNKDIPGFLNQFRRGISYVQGATAEGSMPIYYIHVGRHFTNAQKPEVLQRFVILVMEDIRLLCTPPNEKNIIIFDMNGFGLKNMDWGCVMFILKCLEAYYPESLRRIYIHGAPWIFKGIWNALQPMLDPVVQAKIKFSNKPHELEEFVSRSRLSKAMGGTLDWDWKYNEPVEGENDLMKDTATRDAIREEYEQLAKQWIDVTRQWCNSPSDDLEYRRTVLMMQLRLKWYQLDPYIRARTVYNRNNVLRNDFLVTWEYPQVNGSKESQQVNVRHNVPALVQWLKERNEDTLEDGAGGASPSMTAGESYNVLDGLKAKPKPKSKASGGKDARSDDAKTGEAATGAAAGGAAAGGAAAGGAAATAKGSKSSKGAPKDGLREDVAQSGEQGERRRRSSQQRRRSSRATSSSAEKPQAPKEQPAEGGQDESQSSVGGIAASSVAAASGAIAAGAASMGLTRRKSTDSFFSAKSVEGEGAPKDAGRGADAAEEEDLEDDAEDVDYPVPTTHDHTHDREIAEDYDLDDEERSILSADDNSITPETVLMPQYLSGKPTAESSALSESDLLQDIHTVHKGLELFLNSQMREAEALCSNGAENRLYPSLGMTLLNFVKSLMTFEPSDMQVAMKSCTHTIAIAKFLRKTPGKLSKFVPTSKKFDIQKMSVVERHAELVYAEALLFRALLGVIYSGDTIGVVRQALNLRTSFTVLRNLLQMLEAADSRSQLDEVSGRSHDATVDEDLRSGIYFSNGICMLILSLFPARLLRFIEGAGFSADRRYALELLMRVGGWSKSQPKPTVSAEKEGISRSLCDLALLAYHLIIAARIPVVDKDLEFADKVLSWNLQRYSKGTFFLYFTARLYSSQALTEKAIEFYRRSIESQREYKQLHHLCFWSLSLTYLSACDFIRAYECYDVLSRESNWSKSIYQYAKGAMLYETNAVDREQSSAIMQTVPKLDRRVADRHLSFEKFVRCKALKFVQQHNHLPLPALEFSYLWHCMSHTPVFMLVEKTLTHIDEFIDELEATSPTTYGSGPGEYYSAYCLAFLLRGVALRHVAYPEPHTYVRFPANDHIDASEAAEDSVRSFEKVFEFGSHLDSVDRYMVYFAHLELGHVRAAMGNDTAALREFELILSRKPLVPQETSLVQRPLMSGKASYLLSDTCQMQAHASRLLLGANRTRQKASTMSRSRSVRSRVSSQASGTTGFTREETLAQPAPPITSSSFRGHRDLGTSARESRLYV